MHASAPALAAPGPPSLDDDTLLIAVASLPPPRRAVTADEIRAAATASMLWMEHLFDFDQPYAVTQHGRCLHSSDGDGGYCRYIRPGTCHPDWYGRDARPETWPSRWLTTAQAARWLAADPRRRECRRCLAAPVTAAA